MSAVTIAKRRTIFPPFAESLCHNTAMSATKSFSASLTPGENPGEMVMAAIDAAGAFAETAELSPGMAARLTITVEELVANALEHGGAGKVALELADHADRIALSMADNGIAFDPREAISAELPDPETGGGVGLSLVKAWSRIESYARDGGSNRLELSLPKER